ncbi:sulfatase-like hydrolase/transferase [Flavisericum labens]|uniref:sulfatase-like hydrolase/transferase n=1 Tax=Flavisericum labens TaxID=3377112 RepID=UPI00387A988B
MLEKIRTYILNFLSNSKHIPWLIGLSAGAYPLLKYYNSNFTLRDSVSHFVVFVLLFLLLPIFVSYLIKIIGAKLNDVKKHEDLFFTLINFNFFTFLIIISTWGIKNESLLIGTLIATIFSFLLKNYLKKVIVFQLLMALLVVPKLVPDLYNHFLTNDNWTNLPDDILSVKLKEKPNIYFIQPDGYVNKKTLENQLYGSTSILYDWLEDNGFKVYDNFRSNYSASLISNSSIFSMKQHYFGDALFPSIEMPRARVIISGKNSVVEILKDNGYINYFIVEDEYFQVNLVENKYDFQNIPSKSISYFSTGENIKKDVYKDLESVLNKGVTEGKPKFFFIEKVMPHHVHFELSIEADRKDYLNRINQANTSVKRMVNLINEKDRSAVIIIAADHGGWVGIENYNDFFSTSNEVLVNSIFSTLCAIKWNGIENSQFDKKLKSNVNLFRVLFSALSKNKSYLQHLEEDGSYQLRIEGALGKSVYKLIDEKGNVVNEKIER